MEYQVPGYDGVKATLRSESKHISDFEMELISEVVEIGDAE